MELSSLTFLLTDRCNFNCEYCYQEKGNKNLDFKTVKSALDYFWPHLEKNAFINFSGGEPLLEFSLLEKTVEYAQHKSEYVGKQLNYAITTNGSLIDEKVLEFLKLYCFHLTLSFDGLSQDTSRHSGSSQRIQDILPLLSSSSSINLTVNSVFTPETAARLYDSSVYILNAGIQNLRLSFSLYEPWNPAQIMRLKGELASLREYIFSLYKKSGLIPVENFRQSQSGIFSCSAGCDRLALSPDGKLWGCFLFSDYLKNKEDSLEYSKYCFGDIEEFTANSEDLLADIRANYERISRIYRCTSSQDCIMCSNWLTCAVCPIVIAFSNALESRIPSIICEVEKALSAEKDNLWKQIAGD